MAIQNIEIVNDVLLLSGERPVVSLVTPVGRKGALSVRTAVEDIVLFNAHWPFLKRSEEPVAVTGDILTVREFREVSSLTYKGHDLTPVQMEDVSRTRYSFAIIDDTHLKVRPVGVASDFVVSGTITTDYDFLDGSATIPLPDRFRPLLLVQATYRMAVDHLGDYEQAQAKSQEFAIMARQMVVRESGIGARSRNMYRRRR